MVDNAGGYFMLTQQQIIHRAHELMFEDIGVTSAEPFESQQRILAERRERICLGHDRRAGPDVRNGSTKHSTRS